MASSPPVRPVFVYDGACGICAEWVAYWRRLTAGAVQFRAWQDAGADYPHIAPEQFARAVHFFDVDGSVFTGAAATFRLYQGTRPRRILPWLYRRLPGFAAVCEWAYAFLARRRGLLASLTHLFWGRDMHPPAWQATSWVFLRLLGLIYLGAFVSFGTQITGLIGNEGILPVTTYMTALQEHFGNRAWWLAPMVFWFSAGDSMLSGVCIAGALLALLVVFNRLVVPAMIAMYLLYLSLVVAGQTFMAFQWDLLLLEVGVLALFLRGGSPVTVWLFRWLVFRFFFMGGMVKLLGGDPAWDNLTALAYHFETQPLPTVLAWYAHHLPPPVLMGMTAATLIIELLIPFLVFAPRRLRMFAAWCFIVLQLAILLTGNYNFFNLLALCLCLFLFDDAALHWILPAPMTAVFAARPRADSGGASSALTWLFAGLVLASSSEQIWLAVRHDRTGDVSPVTRALAPCRCVSNYGPFAVMTTVRHEIEIEGSMDGVDWLAYGLRHKPGPLDDIGGWIVPHQPRVDWQMWFAALSRPSREQWFQNLLLRLLQNSPAVAALLESNPFPDRPPQWVRARFYRYEFTTPEQRAETGNWWTRTLVTDYFPPARLQ